MSRTADQPLKMYNKLRKYGQVKWVNATMTPNWPGPKKRSGQPTEAL